MKKSLLNRKIKFQYLDKNTASVILHSGGTTGTPKGIVLSKNITSMENMDLGLIGKREFYMDILTMGDVQLERYITKVMLVSF